MLILPFVLYTILKKPVVIIMINRKAFAILCSTFLAFSLTSCYVAGGDNADFPRHRYKTSAQVKEKIPSDIVLPNFESMDLPKGDLKFFTVNLPGPVVTGYSIEIENISENNIIFKNAELRGIKTSIEGIPPEGFNEECYTCIIEDTPIKISGQDCFYSAFEDKVYSQSELSEQKGTDVEIDKPIITNNNIKYFYIYFQSGEIRYSVTFSEFTNGVDNNEIKDECLKNASLYLKPELMRKEE